MDHHLTDDKNSGSNWPRERDLVVVQATEPVTASILMFGNDDDLLDTRERLLASCGYKVQAASRLSDFESRLSRERFNLVILCHSLRGDDSDRALGLVSQRDPAVKVLVLISNLSSQPHARQTPVLNTSEGPARLISVVGKMVGGAPTSMANLPRASA